MLDVEVLAGDGRDRAEALGDPRERALGQERREPARARQVGRDAQHRETSPYGVVIVPTWSTRDSYFSV